jgi:pimeloyl-ACP methyl ester carboxylesterase
LDKVLDGLDAVAPDLPGFGATAPPPNAWGAADYAAAVAAVCEEEAHPVVLFGHSFGGRVAVMLAASRPDLVSGLVLTGVPLRRPPGTSPPRPALSLRLAKSLQRLGVVSDARVHAVRDRVAPPDYRNAVGVMRDVFVRVVNETDNGTYMTALSGIACPVELIWGENDTAALPSVAAAAAAVALRARLTVLSGVGHLTPLEAPADLRAAIDRVL